MNKAAVASLLAVSALFSAPGAISLHGRACAQTPVGTGQIVMQPEEQAVYAAADKLDQPAAQAAAFEAYLVKYPQSSVKNYVLLKIMFDYYQVPDPAKAMTAADNVLAVDPSNLQAYVINVAFRRGAAADPKTDAATKQTDLDQAATYAKKGLDVAKGPAPAGTAPAQYAQIKSTAVPIFYDAIAEDALSNKDGAAAVDAYKSELAAFPPFNPADVSSTDAGKKQAALTYLQETVILAQAYYKSTPPDYIDCVFYATRAAAFAPNEFKPPIQQVADYCYKKYHGSKDGYDPIVAYAKTHTAPGGDFAGMITPAPTDKQIADDLMKTLPTPDDILKLAPGDKEYVLANASPDNAARVWDLMKGKAVQLPGVLVIESSATVLKVAVSEDAVANKKADYTINLAPLEEPAEPRAKTPVLLAKYKKEKKAYDDEVAAIALAAAVGKNVDVSGTYDSYTTNPIMIIMNDGAVILPKPTPPTKPHPGVRK